MGCGYSKISITGKRGRLKDNLDLGDDSPEDYYAGCSTPEKLRRANGKSAPPDLVKKNGVVNQLSDESLASRRRIANKIKPISGPMRPPINRSDSQMDFFRMLDEKIENGKDFECVSMEDENTHVGNGQVVLPVKSAQLISVLPVPEAACSLPTGTPSKVRNSNSGGKENTRTTSVKDTDVSKPGLAHKRSREAIAESTDQANHNNNKTTKFGPHVTNGSLVRGIQHVDSRPPGGSCGGDNHIVGAVASPTFGAVSKHRASPPRSDSSTSTTSSCALTNDLGQTYNVQAEFHANASASSSIDRGASLRKCSDDGGTGLSGERRSPLGAAPLLLSSQHSMDVDLAADCIIDAAIMAAVDGDRWQSLPSAIVENEEEECHVKDDSNDVKICNSSELANLVANGGLCSGVTDSDSVS